MTTKESTGLRHDETRAALVCCIVSAFSFSSPDMDKGSALNVGSTDQMKHYPSGQNRESVSRDTGIVERITVEPQKRVCTTG